MSATYPVLPVAGGALLRVFASLVALVTLGSRNCARRDGTAARPMFWAGSTAACLPISASPVPTCATPSRSLSGTIRLRSCANAHWKGGSAASVRRAAHDADANRRLPASADRPSGARVTREIKANGRALSSAARSDTRDHPLSRPDPRPPAPPAGAYYLQFNFAERGCHCCRCSCLHNGGGLGYHRVRGKAS